MPICYNEYGNISKEKDQMNINEILQEIRSDSIKNIILDTDTYNEIDDQFALAYAMLSKDKVNILSVNAAPFLNSRSTSPEDGMLKSYNEIFKIIKLTDPNSSIPVYKGSSSFLKSKNKPVESDAANNIINTVLSSESTIYIVAIGAITNVASAIIKCPEITKKCALVWLGGHSLHSPNTREFNLYQDICASQVVFDSKIPLIQIPCDGVCSEFITTLPELEYYLRGKNELCDYLIDIVKDYSMGRYCYSKVIWDVTALATLIKPDALQFVTLPAPILNDGGRYSFDPSRHQYIYVRKIKRDPIYADLFGKLANKN